MMIETAMRFAGGIENGTGDVDVIFSVMKNLQRFVTPSHQLIAVLKMKVLDELAASVKVQEAEKVAAAH